MVGADLGVGPAVASRGSVKITSADPRVHPALRFNYLSSDQDRREWVEAIRVARNTLNEPAFDPYNDGELSLDGLRVVDARARRDGACPAGRGRPMTAAGAASEGRTGGHELEIDLDLILGALEQSRRPAPTQGITRGGYERLDDQLITQHTGRAANPLVVKSAQLA